MSLVCDAHVHIYPCYPLEDALSAAAINLDLLAAEYGDKQTQRAICLTERSDCNFFEQLSAGELSAKLGRWRSEPTADESCVKITEDSLGSIYIFAGRQVATAERLELLLLGSDQKIADGVSFSEGQKEAASRGAIAALNWAPGKWMFSRKEIVRDLIANSTSENLLLCDTSLRPAGWSRPKLMDDAAAKGLSIYSGSDPLPFVGEQQLIGRYGFASEQSLDPQQPLSSLQNILRNPQWFSIVGQRSSLLNSALRNIKLRYR